MNFKKLAKPLSSNYILVAFLVSLAPLFFLVPAGSSQEPPILLSEKVVITPKQVVVSSSSPLSLKIPKIKVNAKFESVGITAKGALDVPKNFSNVAWYNLGPRPGDLGSAIITGHYGIKNGKSSVFDNLYKLRPGDKIYVEDNQGLVTSFVVRKLKRYGPKDKALEVFNSGDNKAHLNLITCEGTWNRTLKSYSRRLVIFTDRE